MRDLPLRVGVIGAGAFAEACHIPGLQSHGAARVVALCGRRKDGTRAMADRLGIPEIHTDHRELCTRPDVDAITIVTPNVCHAEQALAAFAAGKHVLCEKPLGMTTEEARRMLAAAEASGRVHQVAFTFRYLRGLQELRRRIRHGDIGEPFYLRVQYDSWDGLRPEARAGWRERRQEAGGGLLYDIGSHLFDAARFVLGPLERVTGFVHHLPRRIPDGHTGEPVEVETDDLAAAWFRFLSGARGQWWVSRITPPFAQHAHLEVIGREGALRAALSRGGRDWLELSTPSAPTWRRLALPPAVPGSPEEMASRRASGGADDIPAALSRMMHQFVDACLRGKLDGDLDASFYDGLAAQQGLAAVEQAEGRHEWLRMSELP